MYYFCTYFDQKYLPRGLALYHSLLAACSDFQLFVLCLDNRTLEILRKLDLPNLQPISLDDFERQDEALQEAKMNRSRIEYYFTCTPSLPLYILAHRPEIDLITYLDADLFFFAGPEPVFAELGRGSIAIIAHRFPPHLKYKEQYGLYNVGWLSFRRDEHALLCLKWWRRRCLDWCFDRVEGGRFADQKYLDYFPGLFRNVVVIQHKGANLAPWNLANYSLSAPNGHSVLVDEDPLVFFHFHNLKQITRWLYDPGWAAYGVKPSVMLSRKIYAPYFQALSAVQRQLASTLGTPKAWDNVPGRGERKDYLVGNLVKGNYILFFKGHILFW